MKKLIFMLLALIGLGVLFTLGWWFFSRIMPDSRKEVIYLAVAAPLSGSHKTNGEAMLKGIRLYLEQVEQTGQLQNTQISLIEFNDHSSPQVAVRVAADIAFTDKALLVLGHYASDTTLAASDIYKQNGFPIITASASADALTQTNEWCFRIVPDNRWQAEFAAYYIKNILSQNSASIIFDKSIYGISPAQNFAKSAETAGLLIANTWSFDSESEQLDAALHGIITELRSLHNPGALFFATDEAEAVKIITSVKYPGTDYTIIGADAFSTTTFIEELKQYSQARVQAGYYSDGIYVVSPFLIALGNNQAQDFRQAYIAKYAEEPTWVAASYYDAAALAVEAIQRAEIYGKGTIRNKRNKIRATLTELSSVDVAMPGITGNIYFDATGDVKKAPAAGIYQKQLLLPAFLQYQVISDQSGGKSSLFKGSLGAKLFEYEDMLLTKTNVVYTGIDVANISNLDTKNLSYTMDFYLWFRFQEDLEADNITFSNALQPVSLGEPLLEMTDNGITTRAYHVHGDFTSSFTFFRYPFDQQTLRLSFHHKTRPRNSLLYVRDVLGMSIPSDTQDEKAPTITGARWKVTNISHFEGSTSNTLFKQSAASQTIAYSEFNLAVRITRAGKSWIIKSFFPIGLMFLFNYYLYFIPSKKFYVQLLTGFVIILVNALYQQKLAFNSSTQEFILIDYIFFTFSVLAGIALFVAILNYIFHKCGLENRGDSLARKGRILYLILVGLVSIVVTYIYML